MELLKRTFDFYLDASIHAALAVFCLIKLTGFILNIPIDNNLALFLFFGTIASYNFIKYGLEAEKYILVANRYHKNIQFFSFIALAFGLYHSYFISIKTWVALFVLVALTGLYAVPVLPKTRNLRNLSGFKIFPVAMVWAGSTVILPVLQIEENLEWDVWIEAFQRFLIVLILLLPFEIRDLKFDPADLRTIPQRFGVKTTQIIGVVWTILLLLTTFLKDDLRNFDIFIKTAICLSLVLVVGLATKKRSKYYASFWVEAFPIFWLTLGFVTYNSFLE